MRASEARCACVLVLELAAQEPLAQIQRTILGRRMWDTSYHRFIKARVRVNTHTRSAYYLNLSVNDWGPSPPLALP